MTRFLCLIAALGSLAGAAHAADVTIETARGPVAVAQSPAKVAVYDVAALDTIQALGVTPAGVPDNLYIKGFEDMAGAARIGTLFEPNLEALATLGPDLVIVASRSAPQLAQVSAVANAIDMTLGEDLVASSRQRIADYGQIFAREDKAAELTAAFDAKVDALRDAAQDRGNALILMTNGPKVSAYGKGSRFGWIHELTGLPEASEGRSAETHGDAVSFEFIAQTDPDWIFVVDRSAAVGEASDGARATLDNPLVAGTRAAKAGQIVYLSSGPIYIAGGGYRSLTGTMDELLAAFGR